jgi:pimeloyl-ACP methyl ester carboxylesterase
VGHPKIDNTRDVADRSGTRLPWQEGHDVFVRRYGAGDDLSDRPAVLYVHGATFPSALSVGYRIDGRSWADELAQAGFDVWAFDFVGFGGSSRYAEQSADPVGVAPLGRAGGPGGAGAQLLHVLEHIVQMRGGGSVSLVAHSWGTVVAGVAAAARSSLIDRLVLFGPITRRMPTESTRPPGLAAWHPVTVQAQYERFVADVPSGHPRILTEQFPSWAEDWLATDVTAQDRTPPSVRTPSGPRADILAAWSGELAYDPARIAAPTLIVRGEWDSLCTDADARWLLDALSAAPVRGDAKISKGTHLMHLEASRDELYGATATFLHSG